MTPEPRNEAEREFGRWFRRGTGVATARVPVPR
jgi:hypothetical protein